MHPTVLHDIETILQAPPAPAQLTCAGPLEIASAMLNSAAAHQMTSTTVVGELGRDAGDAFRSLVADIRAQYGFEATLQLQGDSYSVRFSRPAQTTIH